jgi:hypothetical protein
MATLRHWAGLRIVGWKDTPFLLYRLYNSQREGRQLDLRFGNECNYGLSLIALLVTFVSDDGSWMRLPQAGTGRPIGTRRASL